MAVGQEAVRLSTKLSAPRETSFLIGLVEVLRRVTGNRIHLLIVLATLAAFSASYWLAYLIRFEFSVPPSYRLFMLSTLPYVLLIKLLVFYGNGVYRILWAYVALRDLYRILLSAAFATGIVTIANIILFPYQLVPRSVLVADGMLTFVTVGGIYALLRSLREANAQAVGWPEGMLEPVFIVGAGDAGEALLRELQRNRAAAVRVVGFLDDDSSKHGSSLRGVKVLGGMDDVGKLSREYGIRKAFIAIPSASGNSIRKIVNSLLAAKIALKILPPLTKLSSEAGYATQLREVLIEDLLRREPVKLDMSAIGDSIRGKVILVTGAAGSIGSELCRQILDQNPSRLVALDLAESPLHGLQLELEAKETGVEVIPELADVTHEGRIRSVFEKYHPSVVFHAAALKHVPMMEAHPQEAVRVNVLGTKIVADTSGAHKCSSFILISSDKAVNPTSVMGATKRIAELMIRNLSNRYPETKYSAVRFGNVLGSNGSVLPIFKAQLAKGGPLTVTHPEMRRFFMTIPEAVQLVLQASVLGGNGELFVLDMGNPILIKDFAADLIRLSGRVPEVDVRIEYIGVRPGEKLFEELTCPGEELLQPVHTSIRMVVSNSAKSAVSLAEVCSLLDSRKAVDNAGGADALLRSLGMSAGKAAVQS